MEIKEKSEVQDKILEAAFRLFCRNGVKSVSMDDIAQYLSVSKKTIYKWFTNKDQIVYGAVQDFLKTTQAACENEMEKAENALAELFNVVEMNKKMLSSLHPSVFYDIRKYHPATWALWEDHKNNFILFHIKENMWRGIREGVYRKDLDVEVMARLRLAQMTIVFNPDFFPPQQFDTAKVQMECLEHFMLGIATLKGHRIINQYKQRVEEE